MFGAPPGAPPLAHPMAAPMGGGLFGGVAPQNNLFGASSSPRAAVGSSLFSNLANVQQMPPQIMNLMQQANVDARRPVNHNMNRNAVPQQYGGASQFGY